MPTIGIAIGFLGFSLFGPLTYWYFMSNSVKTISDFSKKQVLHFIFPFFGIVIIFSTQKFNNVLYFVCSLSLFSYLSYCFFTYLYKKSDMDSPSFNWDKAIFNTMSLLFLVFLAQYFTDTIQTYAIGTALSSFIFGGLFFYMLKNPPNMVKALNKVSPKIEQVDQIITALELDKIYRSQGMDLTKFSHKINIPKYVISIVIRDRYKKSFPDIINYMRVKDIANKLKDPDLASIKVEELAFDVGFNSTSSFYTAFKRIMRMTPREYQKKEIYSLLQRTKEPQSN